MKLLPSQFPILAAPARQPEHDAAGATSAAAVANQRYGGSSRHTPASSRRLPSRSSRLVARGDKAEGRVAVAAAVVPAADWNGLAPRGEDVEVDEVDKLKSKLMAAWNNVKHGWVVKTKTSFSRHSPIYLLGKQYDCSSEVVDVPRKISTGSSCPDAVPGGGGGGSAPAGLGPAFRAFRQDFASRIWMTYRREFPQLGSSGWTTDTGWGCMLRSGQMLLAQGLLHHLLGRDWQSEEAVQLLHQDSEAPGRLSSSPGEPDYVMVGRGFLDDSIALRLAGTSWMASTEQMATYRQILGWFTDAPDSPFGIHKLVEFGKSSGKRAGDWYGPAIVAHILKKAIEEAKEKLLQDTVVYVAQDCTVYTGDVQELCQPTAAGSSDSSNEALGSRGPLDVKAGCCGGRGGGESAAVMSPVPSAEWKALFVLVPVRLGGETLNPVYVSCVKGILEMDNCIGIIGGKPKHSLYFIGYQDDHVIYLDPHYCQTAVDAAQPDFPVESFHCCSPRKTAFTKMDPSCTLGFYCRTRDDFLAFRDRVVKVLRPSAGVGGGGPPQESYPIFSFMSGRSRDVEDEEPRPERHVRLHPVCRRAAQRSSSEDFVLL